ncbi:Hypothetical predicted protein [Pelobates cultripes]|uniref:Uncharacterized protein n=1 Tax=Pelobates cultripes TaxID=61616 RepID=A0AAD1W1Y3_PELCU|nr:Hypothetical predicted protein [Pelobates cultripes]
MEELCSAHNAAADKLQALEADNVKLWQKMADTEDRSRRNNVRFRGIAESILPDKLYSYITTMCTVLAPTVSANAWEIDRVHRLPKPPRLARDTPRDVIARFHYFKSKDTLLQAARATNNLPAPYEGIQLYADLSALTMARRRDFSTITKTLRNHKLNYRWGFPTKLLVWRNGKLYVLADPDQGLTVLKDWGLWDPQGSANPPGSPPPRLRPEWKMVGHQDAKPTQGTSS